MSIPSVPNPFLVGAALDFSAAPLEFLQRNHATYGDIYRLRIGPVDLYSLGSVELVRQVLVTDAALYRKTDRMKAGLGPFLGNGLFLSDGEFWRRQRRLAAPAFHTRRIAAYAETIATYARDMVDGWQDGDERDISVDMMDITLRVVSKTLFDADLTSGDSAQVAHAMEEIVRVSNDHIKAIANLPMWVPTAHNQAIRRNVAMLDEVVLAIIAQRRESGEDTGDLMSMLLLAQDEDGTHMTDQQVRDEVMTIFLAGHETTAIALTWALYLLSQHPQVEAALIEEVDGVLGDRPPTYADLDALAYTEMVIKETMRLYPPVWNTGRSPYERAELAGLTIMPTDVLLITPYLLHHDERYWDAPEVFDPERFHPEREAEHVRYAYIPFGAGPRICIGNHFAMMEAQLILASIVQRYRIRLTVEPPILPEPLITLRPQGGMPVRLVAR